MHLIYIHQYFEFPETSGGTRSYDLAKSFIERGVKVTILTSNLKTDLESKNKWDRIERDGMEIYSINCPYDNTMGFYRRIKSFLSFVWSSSFKILKLKGDVVLATSTPLTIAIPALVKKLFHRTPFIFEVRDVWPEVPIKMGFVKNLIIIKLLYLFEKLVYKKATSIVPLSTGMYNNITLRIKGLDKKMTIIPNISELDRFGDISYKVKFPFDTYGKKILVYCGTLGNVNGISYLVDLSAKTLLLDKNIIYCVVGRGKELDAVLSLAKEKGVLDENFFYMGVVSKNELPYIYHEATVGSSFVIDNPILWDNSANKFFDTLAAHRPVVINHEGWQADTIRKYNCGFVLTPQINDENVHSFVSFMNNKDALQISGENAYRLAKEKYSLQVAVDKYMHILEVFNN